ncbi:hypothetical protein GW891_02490 [bacterium]|nr:hypothetical protein [bacterium]
MIFVIPKIEKMYSDSKVNLPSLTQNVIKTSKFIQENIIYIIFFIILIIISISVFKKNKKTKIYWDYIIIRFPIF